MKYVDDKRKEEEEKNNQQIGLFDLIVPMCVCFCRVKKKENKHQTHTNLK